MTVNINVTFDLPQLKELQAALARIEHGETESNTVLLAIDQRTNEAAKQVTEILDQLKGGLSSDEADKLVAKYSPLIGALNAIAKNGEPSVPEMPTLE